jgi:hypothetical protein
MIQTPTRYPTWALAAALSLVAASADARPLVDGRAIQDGNGIELGVITESGHTEYASNNNDLTPSVQGLVIRDRNGVTSRMAIGLLIAVAGALAQSGPKSVESKTYRDGDYLVTETTTTYYSEAEKAEMRAQTDRSIDGLFNARYSDFELHLFSKERFGRGDAGGYKLNMTVGTGGDNFGVETGLGFGDVTSVVDHAGTPTTVAWKYFGMPLRATMVTGPLRLALTYEWNWLKYGVTAEDRQLHMDADGAMSTRTVSHPWHLDATTVLLHRVALTGGVTAQTLSTKVGFYASVGLLF